MPYRKRSARTLVVTVTALTAALAGCATEDADQSSSGTGGDCEVRSLLVGTMSGLNSDHGIGTQAGAESAVRTINEAGGINGCTLVLDVEDDGGDLTQTLPITQAAMAKQDYAHVNITGYGGSAVLPYLISEQQFAITNLGLADVYDPAEATYQFDTINLVGDSDTVVVEQAVADGATKIGVIVDNTSTGTAVVDTVTAAVEDAGAEVVAVESVDLAAVDYAPVVQRLKSAGADTVFVDIYGASLGYAIRDIKASGWDVPIYAGQIAYVTDLEPLLPVEDYEGVVMGGSAGVTAPSSEAVQSLIDDVVENGDDSIRTHLGGVIWGYDSVTLFAWAANEVGSTDPAEMSTYLEENGDTAVPGLGMAANTGYSADNHDWKGEDSIAVVLAGARDDSGRFPERLGLYTPAD